MIVCDKCEQQSQLEQAVGETNVPEPRRAVRVYVAAMVEEIRHPSLVPQWPRLTAWCGHIATQREVRPNAGNTFAPVSRRVYAMVIAQQMGEQLVQHDHVGC